MDLHREIYTLNNVYKPKIDILTTTANRSFLLLQVGDI